MQLEVKELFICIPCSLPIPLSKFTYTSKANLLVLSLCKRSYISVVLFVVCALVYPPLALEFENIIYK